MERIVKLGLFGFLVWLVPFLVGFLFYTPEGELAVDVFFFQTLMIILQSIASAALLVKYFKNVRKNFVRQGFIVGLYWFAINIVLDILILLPMSGMGIGVYLAHIGFRYLMIPVMSIAIGFVARDKAK